MNPEWRPSALASVDRIRDEIAGRTVGFFLDFDGTLAPIAPRPEMVGLPAAARDVIELLRQDHVVGVISGRGLADLRAKVDIPGIYYAADHGYRIVGPEETGIEHEVGADSGPALAAASKEARGLLQAVPGILVEEKGLSMSIHYRLTPEDQHHLVRQAVERLHADFPSLRTTSGKSVFEFRPGEEWSKGHALRWLLDRLGWNRNDHCPICIGDDLTDEDLFRAIGSWGVSAVVATQERPTEADYSLKDPEQVVAFLALFAD